MLGSTTPWWVCRARDQCSARDVAVDALIVKQRFYSTSPTSGARVTRYYQDVGGDMRSYDDSVPRHPFIGDLSEPQATVTFLNSEAGFGGRCSWLRSRATSTVCRSSSAARQCWCSASTAREKRGPQRTEGSTSSRLRGRSCATTSNAGIATGRPRTISSIGT